MQSLQVYFQEWDTMSSVSQKYTALGLLALTAGVLGMSAVVKKNELDHLEEEMLRISKTGYHHGVRFAVCALDATDMLCVQPCVALAACCGMIICKKRDTARQKLEQQGAAVAAVAAPAQARQRSFNELECGGKAIRRADVCADAKSVAAVPAAMGQFFVGRAASPLHESPKLGRTASELQFPRSPNLASRQAVPPKITDHACTRNAIQIEGSRLLI
jgi:hypothetical protein